MQRHSVRDTVQRDWGHSTCVFTKVTDAGCPFFDSFLNFWIFGAERPRELLDFEDQGRQGVPAR